MRATFLRDGQQLLVPFFMAETQAVDLESGLQVTWGLDMMLGGLVHSQSVQNCGSDSVARPTRCSVLATMLRTLVIAMLWSVDGPVGIPVVEM